MPDALRTLNAPLIRSIEEGSDMARSAFESLFMHAPIPLIVVDGPALRIEHANRAAHKLVGKEKVAGESLLAALPELEEQGCSQWLRDALARGGLQACEYPLRRAASVGASTYWTVLCRQLEERGAHPQGVVVLIDTTTQSSRSASSSNVRRRPMPRVGRRTSSLRC